MARQNKATQEAQQEYERKRRKILLDWMRTGFFREVQTATGEKVRIGRPPAIKNEKDLLREINNYLEDIERRNDDAIYIIPDVEGFCCWLGIDRYKWQEWEVSKTDAMRSLIKSFNTYIAAVKKQLLLSGDIPALPGLADFNNNHGYTNAPQVVRHEVVAELPSVDEIARRLPQA